MNFLNEVQVDCAADRSGITEKISDILGIGEKRKIYPARLFPCLDESVVYGPKGVHSALESAESLS